MALPRKSSKPSFFTNKPAAPVTPPTPAPVAQRSEIKGSGTPKVLVTQRVITQDDIARRAYEIYANRGYTPGDQDADWHEAERQLRAGL